MKFSMTIAWASNLSRSCCTSRTHKAPFGGCGPKAFERTYKTSELALLAETIRRLT